MTTATQQKGLGKGLSTLMGEDYGQSSRSVTITPNSTARDGLNELPINSVHSGEFQPRMHFDEEYLHELADSIEKNGVMQPIVVRPSHQKEGHYEIIAGERRWRASKLAKMGTIPAIIRDIDNQLALELALVENIQRQDLTVLEEAMGYQRLIKEFDYTQEELAHTVGKSRSHITNLLRLLTLPKSIKAHLEDGSLSMGHARALLNSDKAETYADLVVKKGLSVRQTENLVKDGTIEGPSAQPALHKTKQKGKNNGPSNTRNAGHQRSDDPDIIALEETLTQSLGMAVAIYEHGDEAGEITIHYDQLAQLDDVIRRLGSGF
jgi:ParB family chromosome partitioning protein